jgi:hypothetical protein
MATSRFTVSAEKQLLEKAKRMAAARNTTVSAMFTRFLRALAEIDAAPAKRLGPITRRAAGLVKLPDDRSVKDLVAEALAEKHGFAE